MSLDKFLDSAAKIARAIDPLISFVATAQAASGLGGSDAAKAIAMIDGALDALGKFAAGEITAEQAQIAMAQLLDAQVVRDAAADAKLEERFK